MPRHPLALAVLAFLALPAFAQQEAGLNISDGVTNLGTKYTGSVQLELVGEETVCKAYLYIDGLVSPEGTPTAIRFRVPIPAEHSARRLIGVELRETSNTPVEGLGMAKVLEGAKATAPAGEQAKKKGADDFTLVPVLEADFRVSIVPSTPEGKVAQFEAASADPSGDVLVGQRASYDAKLLAADGSELPADTCSYVWTAPSGERLHDYDVSCEPNPDGSAVSFPHGRLDPNQPDEYLVGRERYLGTVNITPTPLTSEHLTGSTLSFYWTREKNEATVQLAARQPVADGTVEIASLTTSVTLTVRRSEIPAREVFTQGALPGTFGKVLPNHSGWHSSYRGTSKFIYFHREFLRLYNSWRRLFGYVEVQAQTDPTQPGYGLDIADYTYLTENGGTTTSPKHQALKLADFATIEDLGDDLESPYHNWGHGTIASHPNGDRDMGSVANAPKVEYFFQWHTKVDNVAREWEYLSLNAPLAMQRDLAGLPGGPALAGRGKLDLKGSWIVIGTGRNGESFTGVAAVTPTKDGAFRVVAQGDEFSWILKAKQLDKVLDVEAVWEERQLSLFPGPGQPSGVHAAPKGSVDLGDDADTFILGDITFSRAQLPQFIFEPEVVSVRLGERVSVFLTSDRDSQDALHLVFIDGGFAVVGSQVEGSNMRVILAGTEVGDHEIQAFVRGFDEPVATFTLTVTE